MKQKKQISAFDCALNFLSYRMRTEKEILGHLQKKEYPEPEIQQAIEKLKEYRYLDDAAFAQEYLRSKVSQKHLGRRALKQGMYQVGVPEEEIEAALAGYTKEAEQQSCEFLCQKLVRRHGADDPKSIAKIQRALLGKGFGYDEIKAAILRCTQETEESI